MNFFNKLPIINYGGYTAKNLLARAKLSNKTLKDKLSFFPYQTNGSERVDNISNAYYDSPNYMWLVWMSNQTVDPYYDMPLSEDNFYYFIVDKYGSFERANRKIAYYKVFWPDEDELITVSEYNSLLNTRKKYFETVTDNDYVVRGYVRKKEDNVVSTNKILYITSSNITGTFTAGEEVNLNVNNYAFCIESGDGYIMLQHVTGEFNANDVLTGVDSGNTLTVTDVITTVETDASTDAVYWQPISYFDHEHLINEKKKHINLLDVRFRDQAEADLKRLMRL
jgi:hypothetical protein